MKYGVLRVQYDDGSGISHFKAFETFEEAYEEVGQNGGYIIKLVDVKTDDDDIELPPPNDGETVTKGG